MIKKLLEQSPQDLVLASVGAIQGLARYYIAPVLTPERLSLATVALLGAYAGAKVTRAVLREFD
jgi:uncharacterized membrane protein YfcA